MRHLPQLILLASPALTSLSAQVPNRIPAGADLARTRALANHHPLWANAQNSVGLSTSQMALTLVMARSPEQQAALEQLLADQKNPASPEYHHWLSPVEIGERFGPSDADLETVKTWIQSQGLSVNWVAPSRTFIGFGGPAANVGQAFQTEIHAYKVNGSDRISVSSDPMIPAAIAPAIKAIHGLYTIDDRPAHFMSEPQAASPDLSLSNGSHFMVPTDFQTIYDFTPADLPYGANQSIGIVGRARTNFDDFYNFRIRTQARFDNPIEIVPTAFGGVDPGPALTAPPTSFNPLVGEQGEATLDVMRAGSVAPFNTNLLLVVATSQSGGIEADAQYLVQTRPLPAQIMTISFGACEAAAGPAGVNFWDSLFQQAAAEGISVFVASGDSGAAGCDHAFTTPPQSPVPISPNYICSSSYATCVGGTEFNDLSNSGLYWKASNGNDLSSALSYIPEGGWNEPLSSSSAPVIAGSGGGVSIVISTPSWQTGTGVPTTRSGRFTPDISFSSACHDGYFACFAAGGAGCASNPDSSFSFLTFCGTSAAAPSMAGVATRLNQKMGFPQGNLNPELYSMAATSPSSFHDATIASSGVSSCSINTPSMCNNSVPGPSGLSGGQTGYLVTNGYDLVTGLGSLDISNFLNNFSSALVAPAVTATPAATTITSAQSLSVTVSVAGSPTPTGTVTLTSGTYSSTATALVNGSAIIVIPPGSLHADNSLVATVTAQYIPDAASSPTYRAATGSFTVGVKWITPTVTLVPSSTSISTAQDLSVTVQVTGGNGNPTPTGTANIDTISASAGETNRLVASLNSGSTTFNIAAGQLAPGDNRLQALYYPDTQSSNTYTSAFASEVTVTVAGITKTAPTISIAPSATNITTLQQITFTVAVIPSTSGAPTPSGTVILSLPSYNNLGSATLTGGIATISLPARTLSPAGTYTFTATYSGDYNYDSVSTSTTVTVTDAPKVTPTVSITPSATSIPTTQQLTITFSVGAAIGYPAPSGTITLTGGSYNSGLLFLNNGSASVTIGAGALTPGVDTLTATYPGDTFYNASTASTQVTVTVPTLTLSGTPVTIASPGAGSTSTNTVTPAGGFTGSVALMATITTSPAGAQHLPTLSFGSTSPVNITGTNPGTATLAIATTVPTTAALHPLNRGIPWCAGKAALACLLLVGIPARRRSLRAFLGTLLLLVSLGSGMLACGGGGNNKPAPTTIPGTTSGNYVVTITGTSGSITATTKINLTVQ
jgi:hypothetical protein